MSILVGAGVFIFALALAAVFDPKIRLLHFLQALIYVAVILLTRRNSAWGYGAGAIIAALWNYTNLFVTNFVSGGMHQLAVLLKTGHLQRPDLLVAVIAAGGHFLLLAACLAGFFYLRPHARPWIRFVSGGLLAVSYFVIIIIAAGPQYVSLLRRTFHL
jgi:hypothetical protein